MRIPLPFQTAILFLAAVVFLASPSYCQTPAQVDPKLPDYAPVSGVSGSINSVGSDTLNNLMTLWAEASKHAIRTSKYRLKGKAPRRPRRPSSREPHNSGR